MQFPQNSNLEPVNCGSAILRTYLLSGSLSELKEQKTENQR